MDQALRTLERAAHNDPRALARYLAAGRRQGVWLGCSWGIHDVRASTPTLAIYSLSWRGVFCQACQVFVPVFWVEELPEARRKRLAFRLCQEEGHDWDGSWCCTRCKARGTAIWL